MLYWYMMMLKIHKILIIIVFIFAILDSFVLLKIRKKNIKINSQYANFQIKYSFITVTAVKAILLLFLFYLLLYPPGNAGTVGAIAIVYCLIVAIFLKDFLKAKRK